MGVWGWAGALCRSRGRAGGQCCEALGLCRGKGPGSLGTPRTVHVGTPLRGPQCHGGGGKAVAERSCCSCRAVGLPTRCPSMLGHGGLHRPVPGDLCPLTARLWQWLCCLVAVFPHTCPETRQRQLLSCLKAIPTPADKGEDCVGGCR